MKSIPVLTVAAALSISCMSTHAADQGGEQDLVCATPESSVNEERFIAIGGIEQWITITGERCDNPLVLMLHGGPGNTLTPFADAMFEGWQRELTLVQWDQRGAGRTFGRNRPQVGEVLDLQDMVTDAIAVVEHVKRLIGHEKVIVTASSWGSVLGIHMIKARPDLFHGYVGASQVVAMQQNQLASYNRVMQLALAENEQAVVASLQSIGPPPWTSPRDFGALRRATRTLESKTAVPPPAHWFVPRADYNTPEARADYADGEEWSFLQFAGLQGDGFYATIDLPSLGTRFEVPIIMIQGENDLVTLPEITREYYDAIEAPHKEFMLIPAAGHDSNQALISARHEAIMHLVALGRE